MRAIFDNAGFAIPGEDVKVAGVKVGKIDSLDVTDDFKAVVVLNIQEKAYQDFRTRRRVHDPPAVADRREVRRVRADPGAPGERRAAAGAGEDRPREGQGPVPAAGLADLQARRPRPDQQHHAPAPAGAAVDHPVRARHRRRRPRRRPQRGHPARQPGAQGGRQGPRDPRLREQDAAAAGRRRRHRPRAAGARAPPRHLRRWRTRPRWRRRPPSAATTSRPTSRACPRSCASCARRWCASAPSPTRRRRCSPTSAPQAPAINRFDRASSARSRRPASRRSSRSATPPRSASRR